MNIGEAARLSGVPAKTIRYYESVGLLPPGARRDNGYRDYSAAEVESLRFIRRARSLGFAVKETGALLELWRDRSRASAEVRALAQQHIAAIDAKTAELSAMRATLATLVERCCGDDRPECPILDSLAGTEAAAPL
jgi:Cu(I)-responsive transcriptional regulator